MSPSLPIPVPSKAAIRALRGLALGTSCALAVVVEDRRRRISVLRTAVSNKKKIRALKHYHGTADAAGISIEDAIVLPAEEMHWHHRPDAPTALRLDPYGADLAIPSHKLPGQAFQLPHVSSHEGGPVEKQTVAEANENISVERSALPSKRPFDGGIYPTPRLQSALQLPNPRDSGGWILSPNIKSTPKPKQIIDDMSTLSVSAIKETLQDDSALSKYTAAFSAACGMKAAFKNRLDDGWLNVSEALCMECQTAGQWQHAQDILLAVVRAGELSEDRFYAHNPLPVLKSIISAVDNGHGDLIAKNLNAAVQIFLAKFDAKPQTHSDAISDLGKTLISRLLKYHQDGLVHQVYWRVLTQQDAPEPFVTWFLQTLFEHRDYKSVIKYFKLNFSKLSPDDACFEEVMRLVLQSVEELRGAQASQVLRYLAKQCDATGLKPRAGWLINMLQAHWGRHQDFAKSQELFSEVVSLGLLDKLSRPEHVYQIMVKLSVLAGDNPTAQYYYQKITQIAPSMTNDVWLNGYMALMKAKSGDWDGVYSDFLEMKRFAHTQDKAYNQTFVAVLKTFMEDHPMTDVEDFIQLYMEKMDVGLHRYVVTLVANMYGELREQESFLNWIRFCSSGGFVMDPGFSNAILRNCRLKWKFPYPVLRKLYSEMRKMQPTSVDTVTVRIMHNAAVSDGTWGGKGKGIQQRIRLLGVPPSDRPHYAKSANERDVVNAMAEELIRGRPAKAISIYRRALRFGMTWCPNCFRLAVKASLQANSDDSSATMKLIKDAHEQGHNVTSAVATFLETQLDNNRGPFEEVMANLKTLITHFESSGMLIDSSVLTHVAIISAKFARHDKAIDLCKLAMEKAGTTNPCFTQQSFKALLMSYWRTLDVKGMRWLVESLPSSPLAADDRALYLLRSTKRHMKQWQQSPRVQEVTRILQDGIDQAKSVRAAHIEAGSAIYNETLRIFGSIVGDMCADERGSGGENTVVEPAIPASQLHVPMTACG